jgi:cellobiose transport system permease protein
MDTQCAEPSKTTRSLAKIVVSRPWRAGLARHDRAVAPYLYVAPFFLLFAVFGLFPLLYTGWVSLHRVSLSTPQQMDWVGLRNYRGLLNSPFFWNALRTTITLGVLSTVPQLCLALWLAHLLNARLRGRTFFRVAVLLPNATSAAAATLVFAQLFGRDFGLINWVLHLLRLPPVGWESGDGRAKSRSARS